MLEPVFENRSIFKRQDELILQWLAEAIVKGLNESEYTEEAFTLDRLTQRPDMLSVIRDLGVYWDDVFISHDTELIAAGAAFLALQGRLDLVYRSGDEYDRVNKPVSNEDEDTLGDLDDHPF